MVHITKRGGQNIVWGYDFEGPLVGPFRDHLPRVWAENGPNKEGEQFQWGYSEMAVSPFKIDDTIKRSGQKQNAVQQTLHGLFL